MFISLYLKFFLHSCKAFRIMYLNYKRIPAREKTLKRKVGYRIFTQRASAAEKKQKMRV